MIAGWIVCVALLVLGRALGATFLIGLFGSFAFGATAVAATTPAYAAMTALLLLSIAADRKSWNDIGAVFKEQPIAYLVCFLSIYAIGSAYFMPKLFANDVEVFVPHDGVLVKTPLGPVSGNFNQSAYILFNSLAFFAIAILLRQGRVTDLRRAYLVWAFINASLGLIDVLSKIAGLGDVLSPIRTASYVMLSGDVAGGFFRIVGGFPEASAYASAGSLPSLAFAFTDWQLNQSRSSLVVAIVLTALLITSTSSTAYGGLGLSVAFYGLAVGVNFLRGRIFTHHVALLLFLWTALTILLALCLYDEHLIDPLVDMLANATINKSTSFSAIERGTWNKLSLSNFVETYGVGVGLGSTRSSSWPISVLAQLGVVGAVIFGIAISLFALSLLRSKQGKLRSLAASASAAALAGSAAGFFGGNGADPGMIFFIALAIVSATFARSTARSVVTDS